MIQFGNKVSYAENKTRRAWKPNVQVKSMYSETLQKVLRFRMTTRAIKNVRKAGGIDNYLAKTKDAELKYHRAIELKKQILEIRKAAVDTTRTDSVKMGLHATASSRKSLGLIEVLLL